MLALSTKVTCQSHPTIIINSKHSRVTLPCHQTTQPLRRDSPDCRLVLPLTTSPLALRQKSLQQTLLGRVLKSSSQSEARCCQVVWETHDHTQPPCLDIQHVTGIHHGKTKSKTKTKKHSSLNFWAVY